MFQARARAIAAATILLYCLKVSAYAAWPTASQWVPFYKNSSYVQDSNTDTNGARNIVSDPNNDVAYYYNDGIYFYFRMRLDQSPAGTGGQGLLAPYGWGMVIDTDQNANNYELLLMIDGVSKNENIALWKNTAQGTLGSAGDSPEVLSSSVPLAGNYAIVQANTSINGDPDYFLDYRFPYAQIKAAGNLTDYTKLRFFFASSSNGSSFSGGGGDLVGGTDLYTGLSDNVTLTGTDGSVRFVADLAGAGDVTSLIAGGTAYLRVDDADANSLPGAAEQLQVAVSAASGDTQAFALTETGLNTGVFTGKIVTFSSAPIAGNGYLEVMPGETATALYNDAATAALRLNQPRTDTLAVPGPVLTAAKTADLAAAVSGSTVTYTVTLTNSGDGEAWITLIQDVLPAGFAYAPGGVSGLTTREPSVSGRVLAWSGLWKIPRKISGVNGTGQLSFTAVALGAPGQYYNNAAASGPNFALVSTGDTAPVSIAAPLLGITKSVSAASALPGAQVTYTALYSNLGNGVARNVTVVDAIPANTAYLPGSLRMGAAGDNYAVAPSSFTDAADSDQGSYSASTGEVTFVLDSVAAGASGTLFFKVTVQ